MEFHCISLKGKREANEDVLVVKENRNKKEYMVGIFDGHGGSFVSEYMGKHLLQALARSSTDEATTQTIQDLHEFLLKEHPEEAQECGSTVLVCKIHPEKQYIQAINLGDSRAVVRGGKSRVVELTRDHKPDTKEERSRIRNSGHRVEWDKDDQVYRVNGFSVSRAVGDADGGGLGRECDVSHLYYTRNDKYLIMACDGVWDVMTSKEACAILDPHIKKVGRKVIKGRNIEQNLAFRLAKHALDQGSMDNISILVVLL